MKTYRAKKASAALLSGLVLLILTGSIFGQNTFRKMNDFDGDGKSDFAVVRNEGASKVWYIWQSRDGFKAFTWGQSGDTPAPGDYDGDGKTDFAIWRGNNFPDPILVPRFWIWRSESNSSTNIDFPAAFRVNYPIPQDYDGDGKTDPALWMGNVQEPPGSGNTNIIGKLSSINSDIVFELLALPPYSNPIRLGDVTGDGRAEGAYVPYNSNPITVNIKIIGTNTSSSIQFGNSTDQFVGPADFDGDGKGDLAIFRPSSGDWWWIRSSDGTARAANWGVSGDTPIPGDYDGDGKTDLAIWRVVSGQGYFWVYGSQNGSVTVFPWGITNDQLVRGS